VVHIASHFVFRPGDDSHSYLLLAGKDEGAPGGLSLTVADFSSNPGSPLRHTALAHAFRLRHRNGRGNAADGSEVDGLSTTAQLKGQRRDLLSVGWWTMTARRSDGRFL